MGKLLHVFRNQKEMKDPFMDQFQLGNRFPCLWMENGKAKANLITWLRIARCGAQANRVFHRVGQSGNQLHPATRTAAGFQLAHIRIHRADEFNRLLGRFLG
jgi:hypothetical protein